MDHVENDGSGRKDWKSGKGVKVDEWKSAFGRRGCLATGSAGFENSQQLCRHASGTHVPLIYYTDLIDRIPIKLQTDTGKLRKRGDGLDDVPDPVAAGICQTDHGDSLLSNILSFLTMAPSDGCHISRFQAYLYRISMADRFINLKSISPP
jgi:hypothetical protein